MNEDDLLAVVTRYIGDEDKARRWIEVPHPFLGGNMPLELIGTSEGEELVLQSLMAIAHGGLG